MTDCTCSPFAFRGDYANPKDFPADSPRIPPPRHTTAKPALFFPKTTHMFICHALSPSEIINKLQGTYWSPDT